jgi:hypothetical protein
MTDNNLVVRKSHGDFTAVVRTLDGIFDVQCVGIEFDWCCSCGHGPDCAHVAKVQEWLPDK